MVRWNTDAFHFYSYFLRDDKGNFLFFNSPDRNGNPFYVVRVLQSKISRTSKKIVMDSWKKLLNKFSDIHHETHV